MKIMGDAVRHLHRGYLNYLKMAEKHRKGTKARLTDILRYIYYCSQDVYPCFIEAEMEETTEKLMKGKVF